MNMCASQSSTWSPTLDDGDQHVPPGGPPGGGGRGPAIDRYNPIIHDQTRLLILNPHFQNNNNIPTFKFKLNNNNKAKDPEEIRKDQGKKQEDNKRRGDIRKNWSIIKGRRNWSCMNMNPGGGFITPQPGPGPGPGGGGSPGSSSRFLLTENTLLNKPDDSKDDDSCAPAPLPFQVVLLKVSLHCRGCEKKLRKHISTMEGVSSYNIEFAAKKVTVEGNVTPLRVLASISTTFKNAQLCFPAPAPAPPQTISEINSTPTVIASSSSSVM